MIIRCVKNTGKALGPFKKGLFYTEETVFDLRIGQRYVVAALGLFQSGLIGLVRDEFGQPRWYPLELFDIETSNLANSWSFRFFGDSKPEGARGLPGWEALWGYGEIVSSAAHLEALTERDPEALRIFKSELDKLTAEEGTMVGP